MRLIACILAVVALLSAPCLSAEEPEIVQARRAMVRQIERNVAETAAITGVSELDARVLAAFVKVPRHLFVPDPLIRYAYADTPLPLGHGQSLSQPFLAALMTHILEIKAGEAVFETGTDTGYQAAILAELGARVFTMEIIEPLWEFARDVLRDNGYAGIAIELGDGYYGWPAHAPYDAMLIKESADDVPPALLQQLKHGGRMVIPLGPADGTQFLTLIRKLENGRIERHELLPVRFTPFQLGRRI
jgi:protein-L-isoaspartate(D-aspartate) O-methyltransferase